MKSAKELAENHYPIVDEEIFDDTYRTYDEYVSEQEDYRIRFIEGYKACTQQFASQPPAPVGKMWEWVKGSDDLPEIVNGIRQEVAVRFTKEYPDRINKGFCYSGGFYMEDSEKFAFRSIDSMPAEWLYPEDVEWLRPVTSSLQGGYSLEQVEELITELCENLSLQLNMRGCCGEGDGKDRKADADDYGGVGLLHRAKQFIQSLNKK